MMRRKPVIIRSLTSISVILAIALITISFVSFWERQKPRETGLRELLANAISPERYISSDDLADRIINRDPSYLLIDVRNEESFKKYSLPEAVHIPLEKIFDKESKTYLDQDKYDVVLYSNDNFYADQAWILCNRLGYRNLYVLKGGMNMWFKTIINPSKPSENLPATAHTQYAFRKAASMYFGVAYPEKIKKQPLPKTGTSKKVVPIKKKKKMPKEGGC